MFANYAFKISGNIVKSSASDCVKKSNAVLASAIDKTFLKSSILEPLKKMFWNAGEVIPNKLYRSHAPKAYQVEKLKELGITTIFDLRGGDIPEDYLLALEKAGIKRINIDMESDLSKSTGKIIEEVKEVLKDDKDVALVHCNMGLNRTGQFVYLVERMIKESTPEQASRSAFNSMGGNEAFQMEKLVKNLQNQK